MNDELLMDLSDCGSPEKLISVILKHHQAWSPPVPILELAKDVNIVEVKELGVAGFEGALLTDAEKSQGAILFKAGRPRGRQRFTISHELGHFLIRTHTGNRQCTAKDLSERRIDSADRRREAEANRFAAGLLMPKPWFERDITSMGDLDVLHIDKLRRRYDVSFEAAANRYAELTDEPFALIFSQNGVVRYARANTKFPHLLVRPGDQLPVSGATQSVSTAGASAWVERDGSTWLATEWGKPSPKILEQTYTQSNGYCATLLQLADWAVSDDEDDDGIDLEKSWAVGFGKR